MTNPASQPGSVWRSIGRDSSAGSGPITGGSNTTPKNSRPPALPLFVSDVARYGGLAVCSQEPAGTAIDIAESNKEGFQYLQTGFSTSLQSNNLY